MNEKEVFTPREVAALVEDLRGEFRAVAEVVLPLRKDMIDVKERLSAVEFGLRTLTDAFRVEFPALKSRVSALESKVG